MSRITKQIAENVAIKLTEKQAKEIKDLQSELKDKFTEIYLKTIPKEVLDLFKKHPDFMETRSSMQLQGNGFNYQYIGLNASYPCKNHVFTPSPQDAKILLSQINDVYNKKSELSKLKLEIETLVFGLRTYAKVKSEFPEAAPFLPKATSTALMVNISDLRKKLK